MSIDTKIIEINAAEGGTDSKLFVRDLCNSYMKLASKFGWKSKIIDERPSLQGHFSISIEICGDNLSQLKNESGGHRLQRISPTERSGRVHTSTVTVSVTDKDGTIDTTIPESDIKIEWYSGSGAGGQHRNRHKNSCRLTHIPSGIISTAQTRSRDSSFKLASDDLHKKIKNILFSENKSIKSEDKKRQVGSGQRGDKIRTIRFQDDRATDHRTGKKCSAESYMNGFMYLLWDH